MALEICDFYLIECFTFRNGGTEAATFCALTTLCKQLESYNAIDCYQVAKLYHDKRPGIWRSPVRMHERYCSNKNRFISMKSFQVLLSILLSLVVENNCTSLAFLGFGDFSILFLDFVFGLCCFLHFLFVCANYFHVLPK